jgi:hypothetical protein
MDGSDYTRLLREGFAAYRRLRFEGQDQLFERRPAGDPVVFLPEHRDANVLVLPSATTSVSEQIIATIPRSQRHKHFGSMQSSQALAQSVFGTIKILQLLPLMAHVKADDGSSAFGPDVNESTLELEWAVQTLGEPRSTSVDVWLGNSYRVAIECKLSEGDFGTCSRPRLKPKDRAYEKQYCDGTYTPQRGRTTPCSLTEIEVRYWDHMEELFGWSKHSQYRPCPLAPVYQLARNILAACVGDDRKLRFDLGHALVIYDQRNPALAPGGKGDMQWRAATNSLRLVGALRRLSWQAFLSQWPRHSDLDWLKEELGAKYGLLSTSRTS